EAPKNCHVNVTNTSPALSMANTNSYADTQKLAVLIGDGFNSKEVKRVLEVVKDHRVFVDIVSQKLGIVTGDDGTQLEVDETFTSKFPVLYDSFYIVGGKSDKQKEFEQSIMEFYYDGYKHYKPIGIASTGKSL